MCQLSQITGGGKPDRGYTREEAKQSALGKEFLKEMKKVLNSGVPIVVSTGNSGDKQTGREAVDMLPSVLESDKFPIITVGATTLDGKAWPNTQGKGSQDGTQVTIYTTGVDVDVHNDEDGPSMLDSGTSYAAPAVAGIIATHMNYRPWDQSKSNWEEVVEIKRWIRTPESSYERVKNQKPDPDKPEIQVNMVSGKP